MSNLETHEAEQAAITALCDIALCGHPECEARGAMEASRDFAASAPPDLTPCERAQQIMDETEAAADADGEYPNRRRAARIILAIAPAYDDDDTQTGIQDAMSDLLHLCDLAGWDFQIMLDAARRNYQDEAHELGPATDDALRAAIERN